MKAILVLFITLILGASKVYSVDDIATFMEELGAESLEFNKTVTDKEILDYLVFQYEIAPDLMKELEEIKNNPEELSQFLQDYRHSHNEAGIKIPILRGLSSEQLQELRAIHKYKKEEHYQAIAASERVQSLTNAQLAIVLIEGEKLIHSYKSIPPTPEYHTTTITENFPEELGFLNLKLIYLYEKSCTLFLQKGIGKGVGFAVTENNGEWKLESFDEYKSWERHEITIP